MCSSNLIVTEASQQNHVHTADCKGTHIHNDSCYDDYVQTISELTNKGQRIKIKPTSVAYPEGQFNGHKVHDSEIVTEFMITDIQGITQLQIGVDAEVDCSGSPYSGISVQHKPYLNGEQLVSYPSNLILRRSRYTTVWSDEADTSYEELIGYLVRCPDNDGFMFTDVKVGDTIKVIFYPGTISGWKGTPGSVYLRVADISGAEAHGSFTISGRGMLCTQSVIKTTNMCSQVVINITPNK